MKDICRVLNEAQKLQKHPVHKRKSDFGNEMYHPLNFFVFQHIDPRLCDCIETNKVLQQGRDFLSD